MGFGDRVLGPAEAIPSRDFLTFAGIAPVSLRLYPRETHIAEKLHAYTQPRPRENTRVRDLPDLAILAQLGPLEADRLRAALASTYGFRDTHPMPLCFADPPHTWEVPYQAYVTTDRLPWPDLASVTLAVRTFLDPVLAGSHGRWDPARWRWETRDGNSP